jgi:sulfite reductase alpha subunit-like flavoprotein
MNSKGKEVPHGVRLYSIASSRYGDAFDGKTATLCVRRATYWDPEMNKEDPAKKGICSNFLCDAKPGTKVSMTGACFCVRVLRMTAPPPRNPTRADANPPPCTRASQARPAR